MTIRLPSYNDLSTRPCRNYQAIFKHFNLRSHLGNKDIAIASIWSFTHLAWRPVRLIIFYEALSAI